MQKEKEKRCFHFYRSKRDNNSFRCRLRVRFIIIQMDRMLISRFAKLEYECFRDASRLETFEKYLFYQHLGA